MVRLLTGIRRRLKRMFDRIRNERMKQNVLQAIPFWIGSLLTGLVAVAYAIMFSYAEKGAEWMMHKASWSLFIATPVCFLFAWWLVKKYAPFARGSGIPQVIAAIELSTPKDEKKINRLLNLKVIWVKIVSSLVMAFGGGVVGREGPTIQIAGSIFRTINQWLPAWWPKISRRNMIMTGAAAGLAAAFNTPLGGLVFAVEELTRTHISYFRTALFTGVILAGLTAQALLGPYLYLGYPDVSHLSGWIFAGVLLTALIAGLGGSALCRVILRVMNIVGRWKVTKKIIYIIACALAIALISFVWGSSMVGSGKEIMTQTLFTNNKHVEWYVPFLRMLGSLLSFTTGGAGGVFAPALAAGASVGSVLSGWLHCTPADANILILAGMVAFLTGVTRTPFTSAILVLEMTDRHNVIFHLMLAGMVAYLVSMLVDKRSFYDHLKHRFIHEAGLEPALQPQPETPPANPSSATSTNKPDNH
ncbi:chloride channel protein [Pseudobacter ginsenosidimutans]|uniref:H+/Cl-antiporter ClcA n=1 Tax=Pseudobacter ginsenosidimutans TaxID=661488 RepID=A0A4Q7MXB6_9BACT|nr:chloride channel protein [Pseudobacter ginsenosidimutans]QEC40572.1 chloride channel protein [Pseudobacter ginsenosidimutans]RZS72714.1 H+/Cl- antiporter ClcA [Pseudobacter ginsenosidimutans]